MVVETAAGPKTLVMKFGGTSVGSPSAVAQAGQIVRQASLVWPRLVVVTSAMSGVTNLLLESAFRAVGGDTSLIVETSRKLTQMHMEVIRALIPELAEQARAGGRNRLIGQQLYQLMPGDRRDW